MVLDFQSAAGDKSATDRAHQGPGFPTWHRLLLVWLERELQLMLGDHLFRFHFWNWLDPGQRGVPFLNHRLGATNDSIVTGDLVDGNWSLICWENVTKLPLYEVCDPRNFSESRLIRCPNATLCEKDNPVWPSYADYYYALSIENYDSLPYTFRVECTEESYRNYMEGFLYKRGTDCRNDPMCTVEEMGMTTTLKLHNVVSLELYIALSDSDFLSLEL